MRDVRTRIQDLDFIEKLVVQGSVFGVTYTQIATSLLADLEADARAWREHQETQEDVKVV